MRLNLLCASFTLLFVKEYLATVMVLFSPMQFVSGKFSPLSFNPLSPNGDQNQFSPNDIHTLSRD